MMAWFRPDGGNFFEKQAVLLKEVIEDKFSLDMLFRKSHGLQFSHELVTVTVCKLVARVFCSC